MLDRKLNLVVAYTVAAALTSKLVAGFNFAQDTGVVLIGAIRYQQLHRLFTHAPDSGSTATIEGFLVTAQIDTARRRRGAGNRISFLIDLLGGNTVITGCSVMSSGLMLFASPPPPIVAVDPAPIDSRDSDEPTLVSLFTLSVWA